MQDLKLIDNKEALNRLFILINSWLNNYRDSNHKIAFNHDVLAERIFNLLTSEKVSVVKDQAFKNRLLQSISFQIRLFLKVYTLNKNGNHLLLNKTLFTIGKALNSNKISGIAVSNIILFLKKNILADGGMLGKSPSDVLKVLEHTLFVFKNLNNSDLTYKSELRILVDKIIIFIKSMRYKDGGLGVFNGGYEEDSNKIDFLLSLGNINAQSFSNLRYSGYINLSAGDKTKILLKTNSIATENKSNINNNSILSQEVLLNGERVFVNNNKSNFLQDSKTDRSAHSTVLFFDKNNKLINMPQELKLQDCKVEQRVDSDWKTVLITYNSLKNNYGVVWHKSLNLAKKGSCILGEELLSFSSGNFIKKAIVKFILHPGIIVNNISKDEQNISLEITNESWTFRSSRPFFINNEIYSAIKEESFPTLSINIVLDAHDKSVEWSLVQSTFLNSALQKYSKKQA